MAVIHPTAIVDREVELADDVRIGAYSIIRGRVRIGAGTVVHEHTHIHGITVIGRHCVLGPAAYVGLTPQHLRFDGEGCWLILGDGVTIRETASAHRATVPGEEHATRLGNGCYIMAGSHVAHDCQLGKDVMLCNGALLGGHCVLGDRVVMGGASALHQFVHVGRVTIFAGHEGSSRDVPPFAAVRYNGLKGYNAVGCRRAGIPAGSITSIRAAYHCIHRYRNMADAVKAIRDSVPPVPEVKEMLDFIAASKRGIHPSMHFLRAGVNGDDGE
jgi:UDP-N-acetylglucosamine acyltransferase